MRRIQFANDNFYHIYNRGTEKRKIFLDDKDYFRFIHDLYEFNDERAGFNVGFRFNQNYRGRISIVKDRKQLVDIISFCLIPNHFHLILRQRQDKGITKFMQKIGTGYTMYFNQKNKRSGALFQGRFKAILVDKDDYFLPLTGYIHFNPVGLLEPEWREKGINNRQKVKEFLKKYRWSSLLDYTGVKNFPSLIDKEFLLNFFGKKENYIQYLTDYLFGDLEKIKGLTLE